MSMLTYIKCIFLQNLCKLNLNPFYLTFYLTPLQSPAKSTQRNIIWASHACLQKMDLVGSEALLYTGGNPHSSGPQYFWEQNIIERSNHLMLVAAASCVPCRLWLRYFDFLEQITFLCKLHMR